MCKGDVSGFLRRSGAKIAVATIMAALAIVFAVRNAFAVESIGDYFENGSGAFFSFVRGDGSLFTLAFVTAVQFALVAAFAVVCAFNDLLANLSLAAVAYATYVNVFGPLVVLRYYSVRALPLVVLCLVVAAAVAAAVVCYASFVIDSQCRYRYGRRELLHLVSSCVPFYIAFAALTVVKLLAISIGCVFI